MIRYYFRAFLVGILLCFASTIFAQQKITVLDKTSGFPVHDVYVTVYCQVHTRDTMLSIGSELPYLCGEFFTNKRGKFQTDLFDGKDSTSFKISFLHENYIVKRLYYDSLANREFKVFLESNANTLDEMVVSANRIAEKKRDVIQKIRVIKSEEIQNQNQSSMADLVGASGNVFVQKSQLGGGSPIIRGFETNKVLMVVDGVRLNNAIYRGGHLQNIITLDNSIMDRVEVLFLSLIHI